MGRARGCPIPRGLISLSVSNCERLVLFMERVRRSDVKTINLEKIQALTLKPMNRDRIIEDGNTGVELTVNSSRIKSSIKEETFCYDVSKQVQNQKALRPL